jgi:hypothetical protein
MGCDIHFYVETQQPNGIWKSADTWVDEYQDGELCVPYDSAYYNDRNYDLFAILADVRNGRGFAGVETGDGFNPISAPKGLPSDCSPQVKASAERWGCNGHSHSWLTVSELLAYDWTQETELTGLLDPFTFAEWEAWERKQGGNPKRWCADALGPNVKVITEAEARKRVAEITSGRHLNDCEDEIRMGMLHTYTRAHWTQKYYQCASGFLSETMPRLWALEVPDKVRIVFWFDN